jgi:adenylate cyclase
VLEASRGFHLAHASMCGGRARCSTCRIRVTAGEPYCPPPSAEEQATLARIHAPPDVRLACQLRPQGDVSVVPLVRTARPIYRATAAQRSAEQDIVVLYCDVVNFKEWAHEHMPQDVLYVLTLYVETLGNAIRAAGGTLSSTEPDSVCALFGLDRRRTQAAQQALQAASAMHSVIADLNDRLGRQKDKTLTVVISIHAGRAASGEVGSSDPPLVMAIGEAVDAASEIRKAAAARAAPYAISEPVYSAANLEPIFQEKLALQLAGADAPTLVYLSDAAPVPHPSWMAGGERMPRAKTLQRLWKG